MNITASALTLIACSLYLNVCPHCVAAEKKFYFLAATPTYDSPQAYPADLYSIEASKQMLKLIREIASPSTGVDYIRYYPGFLAVGHPHIKPTVVELIHFADPKRSDPVKLEYKDTITTNVTVDPPQEGPLEFIAVTKNVSSGGIQTTSAGLLPDVSGYGVKRIIKDVSWSILRYLYAMGQIGGPIGQWDGLQAEAVSSNVIYNTPTGPIVLLPSVPEALSNGRTKPVSILCSNTGFLILALVEDHGVIESRNQQFVYVYARNDKRWSTLSFPGNYSRLRLFGNWLSVIVAQYNPTHSANPGNEHFRTERTDRLPSVAQLYSEMSVPELLPGILKLVNLQGGRTIQIDTGQADSEILLVSGDTVLYRINNRILSGRIAGSKILNTTLLVEDENVPEIHWAFEGPASPQVIVH